MTSLEKRLWPDSCGFYLDGNFITEGKKKNILNLIREFLGSSPSAISGKKSKNIAGDITFGTKKIKLYVQIKCQLGLSYDANFKWHMSI